MLEGLLMEDAVVVRQKPVFSLLYAIGALVFVLASGFFILVHFDVFSADLGYLGTLIVRSKVAVAVFILGFVFFFWAFQYYLRRIVTRKPLLIVDKEGITDNSSALAVGFIPWEDIKRTRTKAMGIQPFILVTVKSEEKYLKKINPIGQLAAKVNKRMGYEIICINLNTTGVSPYAVSPVMEEMRKEANKREKAEIT
jgi:hypothetical protein